MKKIVFILLIFCSFIIRKTKCSTIVKRNDAFSKRNVFFLFPLHYKNNVIIIAF